MQGVVEPEKEGEEEKEEFSAERLQEALKVELMCVLFVRAVYDDKTDKKESSVHRKIQSA